MDSFVYNRLQTRRPQIRLVLLLPGLDHEKLSCGLITVFLDDAPQYEALSYTWGDPNVKVPILLHGQDFLVGTNLKAALCHLRLVTRVRKLWIDAVCINQADICERNHQVQIMRNIYTNADKVLVWLGESSEDSGIAMHILEDFSDGIIDYKAFGSEVQPSQREAVFWQPVTNLFERPWWARGWIVQEIVLAQEAILYCGRRSIQWDILSKALYRLMECDRRKYEPFKGPTYQRVVALKLQRDDWRFCGVRSGFSELLDKQRFRELSDPKDIIYSTIGLAEDLLPGTITPDYSQSVEQLYRNTARTLIHTTRSLDILRHVWLHINNPGFPSWVRDWREGGLVRPFYRGVVGESIYRASGNSRVITKPSENMDILILKGFHFDNVAEIFEFGGKEELGFILGSWKKMTRIGSAPHRPYIGSGDFFNAFWRTIIANQGFEVDERKKEEQELVKAPEEERDIAEIIFGLKDLPKDVCKEHYLEPFATRMRSKTLNRRMVLTEKGYLGLVPPETEKEDLVCILLGGDMPFILRAEGSYYKFVGESYVHGIMDGEVFDMAQAGLVSLQDFSLR
jgi:hypothetical protein